MSFGSPFGDGDGKATPRKPPRSTIRTNSTRTPAWDRGVNGHAYLAWCNRYLGHHDQALAPSEKADALAKRIDHPLTLANVLLRVAIHR